MTAPATRTARVLGQRHGWVVCDCDGGCGTLLEVTDSMARMLAPVRCGSCEDVSRYQSVERHPLYGTWSSMRERCSSPTHHAFANYGGRGISVCERWRASFAAFVSDVGGRPSPKHSLDRINNDGDYEPCNVRWATVAVQRRNSRVVRLVTFNGETRPVYEWAAAVGVQPSTLTARLNKGWPVGLALRTEVRPGRRVVRPQRQYQHDGKSMTLMGWAKAHGININTLSGRLRKGWPMDVALSFPVTKANAIRLRGVPVDGIAAVCNETAASVAVGRR